MLLYLQRAFLAAGTLLLTVFAVAQVHGSVGKDQALDAFRLAQAQAQAQAQQSAAAEVPPPVVSTDSPDLTLWADGRIEAYRESLSVKMDAPQGVLRIDHLDIEVPIFEGTSELNLNRGVGWIEGTAQPGETGNIGIAGHRDGFFRGLKDISVGDEMLVESMNGSMRFRVSETLIVEPTDTEVLDPTDETSLTLVTCYPFYFVGNAPQRFIVRGVLADTDSGSET